MSKSTKTKPWSKLEFWGLIAAIPVAILAILELLDRIAAFF